MGDIEGRLDIYLAHRKALVDYAAPLVGSRAQAEDLVQEAYFRFVSAREDSPSLREPAAYLYRIVQNLAVDLRRRLSAQSRRDADFSAAAQTSHAPSPEDELLHRQELQLVRKALSELPEAKRRAFEMSRLGGMTFHEIARELNVSVATAHRMAQDALVHVMKRLQRPVG